MKKTLTVYGKTFEHNGKQYLGMSFKLDKAKENEGKYANLRFTDDCLDNMADEEIYIPEDDFVAKIKIETETCRWRKKTGKDGKTYFTCWVDRIYSIDILPPKEKENANKEIDEDLPF